jgi:hypothetical protein
MEHEDLLNKKFREKEEEILKFIYKDLTTAEFLTWPVAKILNPERKHSWRQQSIAYIYKTESGETPVMTKKQMQAISKNFYIEFCKVNKNRMGNVKTLEKR